MSKKNTPAERLYNGIVKENPTFVLTLGMCPTLAVTTSAVNGLGMGLTTMVVLALCNLIISALRKIIPDKVRIPAFIVIAASLVTMMHWACTPREYNSCAATQSVSLNMAIKRCSVPIAEALNRMASRLAISRIRRLRGVYSSGSATIV